MNQISIQLDFLSVTLLMEKPNCTKELILILLFIQEPSRFLLVAPKLIGSIIEVVQDEFAILS
jgi:hypothetical protein